MKKILKIGYTMEDGGLIRPLPEFCLPQLRKKLPLNMPLEFNDIIPWFGLFFLTKDGFIEKYNINQLKYLGLSNIDEIIKNDGWFKGFEPKRFVVDWEEWTLTEW